MLRRLMSPPGQMPGSGENSRLPSACSLPLYCYFVLGSVFNEYFMFKHLWDRKCWKFCVCSCLCLLSLNHPEGSFTKWMRLRNTAEAPLEAFAAFLFRYLLLGIILQETGWTVEVDARCMQVLWTIARESPCQWCVPTASREHRCQQWAPTASHPGCSSLVLHQGEESIINLQNCVIHGLVFQAIAFNGTWLLQMDYMKRSMCSVYGLIYFCQIDTNQQPRVVWWRRTLAKKMHSSMDFRQL